MDAPKKRKPAGRPASAKNKERITDSTHQRNLRMACRCSTAMPCPVCLSFAEYAAELILRRVARGFA